MEDNSPASSRTSTPTSSRPAWTQHPEGLISVGVAASLVVFVGYLQLLAPQPARDYNQLLTKYDTRYTAPPDSPETTARFARAFAEQNRGHLADAISQYWALLADHPNHIQIRFNLAHALMTNGQCEIAMREFRRVVELDPTYKAATVHIQTCKRCLLARARGEVNTAKREPNRARRGALVSGR